mgnify:CR=1 FL=1
MWLGKISVIPAQTGIQCLGIHLRPTTYELHPSFLSVLRGSVVLLKWGSYF